MASALKSILDYNQGSSYVISKGDKTANGEIDENETQISQFDSYETEGKDVANVAFGKDLTLVAERMVATDMYDIGQSNTRIKKLYHFTRKDFYDQNSSGVQARQNRIAYKTNIATDVLKKTEAAKSEYKGA